MLFVREFRPPLDTLFRFTCFTSTEERLHDGGDSACGLFVVVFGLCLWSLFFSPPSDCFSLPSTMTWAPCPHGVRTRGKKGSGSSSGVEALLSSSSSGRSPRAALRAVGWPGDVRMALSPRWSAKTWNQPGDSPQALAQAHRSRPLYLWRFCRLRRKRNRFSCSLAAL